MKSIRMKNKLMMEMLRNCLLSNKLFKSLLLNNKNLHIIEMMLLLKMNLLIDLIGKEKKFLTKSLY